MRNFVLEATNRCNRSCLHCFRNKADPPGFLPLETAAAVLSQAEPLGFKTVCLTGGEVALYPHLGELLRLIAEHGFDFTLVTNGFRFRDYVLPLLLEPEVKERVHSVCFSLDGARPETHDALRGPKSFQEVVEGVALCRAHQVPASLKSVITALNRDELTDLALLGVRLGAMDHAFLCLFPTPGLMENGVLLPPGDMLATARWIGDHLMETIRSRITVEGYSLGGVILNCGHLVDVLNVDYQGNLIFCCALSHVTLGDGIPTSPGRELVADLKEVSLKEGIVRQFRLASEIMAARLNDDDKAGGVSAAPCHWCFKYFGKLDWLKDFPDSPWTAWIDGKESHPEKRQRTPAT